MPDRETGFCFQYSVEKTEDKGLGVFARETIKKGSIVWRHVPGLYVVYDEHSFSAKIEKMSPADVVYELTHVFGLEDFPGCLILALDDGVLINHSSDSNLVTNNSAPASTSFDVHSQRYLHKVTEALLDDRYSLVATRDIENGEELTNDYSVEDDCPPYYDVLYEQYGVCEDFLDDC
jgi:hypothetical protein